MKESVTLSLPDVMYDPTWVGLGEVDFDPEDIGGPDDAWEDEYPRKAKGLPPSGLSIPARANGQKGS